MCLPIVMRLAGYSLISQAAEQEKYAHADSDLSRGLDKGAGAISELYYSCYKTQRPGASHNDNVHEARQKMGGTRLSIYDV